MHGTNVPHPRLFRSPTTHGSLIRTTILKWSQCALDLKLILKRTLWGHLTFYGFKDVRRNHKFFWITTERERFQEALELWGNICGFKAKEISHPWHNLKYQELTFLNEVLTKCQHRPEHCWFAYSLVNSVKTGLHGC